MGEREGQGPKLQTTQQNMRVSTDLNLEYEGEDTKLLIVSQEVKVRAAIF